MSVLNQFVIVNNSITNIKENHLDMVDVYVYAFLKMYMDKNTRKAKIALETLSERAGISNRTIQRSLQNLRDIGYIDYKSIANICTTYEFIKRNDGFEKIPYVLLLTQKLTYKEKAYALCIQRYIFNVDYTKEASEIDQDINYTLYSPVKLSEILGISKNTAIKYTESLQEKGFIMKIKSLSKTDSHWIFNFHMLYRESEELLSKLTNDRNQLLEEKDLQTKQYLKTIKMLEERVSNLEKLVSTLTEENEDLKINLREKNKEVEIKNEVIKILTKQINAVNPEYN